MFYGESKRVLITWSFHSERCLKVILLYCHVTSEKSSKTATAAVGDVFPMMAILSPLDFCCPNIPANLPKPSTINSYGMPQFLFELFPPISPPSKRLTPTHISHNQFAQWESKKVGMMGTKNTEGSDGLGDGERARHRTEKKRGQMEDLSMSTQIKHTHMESNLCFINYCFLFAMELHHHHIAELDQLDKASTATPLFL